jgi:trk system potassium uptake protein
MNIIIVGGGNIGYSLAERLGKRNYVVLIERNREIGRTLAEKSNSLIIRGDGCDPAVLKQAGIKKTDVVAAVTGKDEDNLVICQIAKEIYNVKRTVAKVNNPRNEKIFSQLGVDIPIDSTALIAKVIEEEISWDYFINLFTFKRGNLSIMRIDLPENSPVLGMLLNKINLPEDSTIVGVIRGNEIITPDKKVQLEPKDEVIAITKVQNESVLFKTFIGEVEK